MFDNFFLGNYRLWENIYKNKIVLELAKEYSRIFSDFFENFFEISILRFSGKSKISFKKSEKILEYSLTNFKTFLFYKTFP